ncbi:hypothetical protein AB1K70_26470 [Bremerella sp. JC770]|uniref:hypothetical protein n=1 Tax=Bremerella sp. JC770 TaxID=3232137 RepID=UPI003458083D
MATYRIDARYWVAACLMVASVGCGPSLPFYNVQGEVLINGEPVKYAEMHIDPTSEGDSGRTVPARVVDGKFTTPIGVAAGPAEWTFSVVDTTGLKINDYHNLSDSEDGQIVRAKKEVFVKQIEVDREKYVIELP